MTLPHADEIRAARARANRARDAASLVSQLEQAQLSLRLMEGQLDHLPPTPMELPGEEAVHAVAEHFPDLEACTPPAGPPAERLTKVASEVARLLAALQPTAQEAEQASEVLSTLQRKQREALEHPQWADEVKALARLGEERVSTAQALEPIERQLVVLGPARNLIEGFQARLSEQEGGAAASADPMGAWRAASLAAQAVEALRETFESLGLEMQLPSPLDLPSDPTAADPTAMWALVASTRAELAEVDALLGKEQQALAARAQELNARHQDLSEQLLERMG